VKQLTSNCHITTTFVCFSSTNVWTLLPKTGMSCSSHVHCSSCVIFAPHPQLVQLVFIQYEAVLCKEVVQKECQARNLNREDAMDLGRWKKLIKIGWWSGWWVGECFFWYRLTRVVPDKGPQNVAVVVEAVVLIDWVEVLHPTRHNNRSFWRRSS